MSNSSFLTRIKTIRRSEGKKAEIVLSETLFHPSGGGQPGDTGKLRGLSFSASVSDTLKDKETGDHVLELKIERGIPAPGMEVVAEVDTVRNRTLSRMHTGQHIFSRLQENRLPGLETQKVYLGTEESIVYVRYDGELDWDVLFETERMTVEAIRRNLAVESFYVSRDDAGKFPELKIKRDRIPDEWIRVVSIPDLDATACSGTHVPCTGDIGNFMVTGFNGSSPDWEIRFTVDTEDRLSAYGQAARRLLRRIGCPLNQLEDVFVRQKEESAGMRQVLDKVRSFVSIPWEARSAGGHPLYVAHMTGLTKELLSAPARRCVEENGGAFCLVLLPGTSDAPFPFLLLRGANVDTDLSGFLRKFPELRAKGGGKPDWLNGTTTQGSLSVWIECLERHLRNAS